VEPVVNRGAWFAFSESILQTLLCSADVTERRAGIRLIKEHRDSAMQQSPLRLRRTPTINFDATSLVEMITWESDVFEPPLAAGLSLEEIACFEERPMEVPDWYCHTQAIERVVKQVSFTILLGVSLNGAIQFSSFLF